MGLILPRSFFLSGFISIHRKITEWEWYDDANTLRLFLHLLLTANYKPSKYRGHDIPAGSCVVGRIDLSQVLCLSEQKIRTSLDKLKSTNEITIKTTNKFSIISICKWNHYQTNQPTIQPTNNQQITTSKEGNKGIIKIKPKGFTKKLLDFDFIPPEDWKDVGIQSGLFYHELPKVWKDFRDWHVENGIAKADWKAAWSRWTRKEAQRKNAG